MSRHKNSCQSLNIFEDLEFICVRERRNQESGEKEEIKRCYQGRIAGKAVFVRCWLQGAKSEFQKFRKIIKPLEEKHIPGYANIHNIDDDNQIIISEFVPRNNKEQPAKTLTTFIEERKRLSPAEAWIILSQIVSCALAFKKFRSDSGEELNLHLHLDLHPNNILLEDEDSLLVRIVDLRADALSGEQELLQQIGKEFYFMLSGVFDKRSDLLEKTEFLSHLHLPESQSETVDEIKDFLTLCGMFGGEKIAHLEKLRENLEDMKHTVQDAYPLPPVYTYGAFYSFMALIFGLLLLVAVFFAGRSGGLTGYQALGFAPLPTFTPTPTMTISSTSGSLTPTIAPSASPTLTPTIAPSASPTLTPTIAPSASPTLTPTIAPSVSPTLTLTPSPSSTPSPTATHTPMPTLTSSPDHNPIPISPTPTFTPTPTPTPPKLSMLPNNCDTPNKGKGIYFIQPDGSAYFEPGDIEVYVDSYQYFTIRYSSVEKMPSTEELIDWPAIWECDEKHGVRCQREVSGPRMKVSLGKWHWTGNVQPPGGRGYYLLLEVERPRPQGHGTEITCTYVYVPPSPSE